MSKKTRSTLFQARPSQLLLDERVSKIVLPSLQAMEELEDIEEVWVEEESDEVVPEETLQIFVGSAETEIDPAHTWQIDSDEEMDTNDDSDEMTVSIPLQIPSKRDDEEQYHKDTNIPVAVPLQSIREIYDDTEAEQIDEIDEWDEINWDEVTLSDILGEETATLEPDSDEYASEEDSYGASLASLFSDELPQPLALGKALIVEEESDDFNTEFDFAALFTEEAIDPLEEYSYEANEQTISVVVEEKQDKKQENENEQSSENHTKISLDDIEELSYVVPETEWWQHPFLVFVMILLGTMSLFMFLLQQFQ